MWYDSETTRWSALRADLKAQDKRCEHLSEIQMSMLGLTDDPANHLYEAATLVLPQIVYQEPRLAVESRVPGDAAKGAVALKWALEAEMGRQGLAELWERVGTDFLAVMGVTMVTMEENATRRLGDDPLFEAVGRSGQGARKAKPDRPRRPNMVYLSPREFCYDNQATSLQTCRRMAHCYVVSRSALEDRAERLDKDAPGQWDMQAIRSLKKTDGARRRGKDSRATEDLGDDEVRIWEIWVPSVYNDPKAKAEDETSGLFHGTVYTMAEQGESGTDVRAPYLYFGPATGPYQVYWGTPVPDQAERLSIFRATDPQRRRHSKHGRALTKSSENYKRVGVTSSEAIKRAVDDAEHDSVVFVDDISVQDIKDSITVFEVGGPSAEMIAVEERSSEQLDRVSGINENKRGVLAAGATATEASIANEAGDLRVAMLRTAFHRSAKAAVAAMAWYMWHSEDVVVRLPLRAAEEAELADRIPEGKGINYRGGDGIELAEKGVMWDDLMIEFVPYSMQRTSEAELRQKGVQLVEMVQMLLETKGADPNFPIAELADIVSSQMNMPGLGKVFEHLKQGDQPQGPVGMQPPRAAPGPDQIRGGPRLQGNQTGGELAGAQR